MPSCEAIWCRSLRRLRSRVPNSLILVLHLSCSAMRKCFSSCFGTRLSKLEALQPGLGLEGVDGVHKSYHTGFGGHDDRVRPPAAPEIPDAVQGLPGRDAGSREDHVLAPDQIFQGQLTLGILEPVVLELLDLQALRRPHPSLHLPAEALCDGRCENTLRCPPDPDYGVEVR